MITNQAEILNEVTTKIRKLLALSTSGNQAEAELAMTKCKELAERYQIDIAAINPFDENKVEEKYGRTDFELGKRLPIAQKFTNFILINHFNVRVIMSGGRYNGRKIVLIGKDSDLAIAQFVQSYLNDEFLRLWHKYYKTHDIQLSERSSYLYGLYRGIDEKLKANKNKFAKSRIEEIKVEKGREYGAAVENKYSLMVINQAERLETEVGKHFPRLTHKRTSFRVGHREDVISDGIKAGHSINLNRPISSGNTNQIRG